MLIFLCFFSFWGSEYAYDMLKNRNFVNRKNSGPTTRNIKIIQTRGIQIINGV